MTGGSLRIGVGAKGFVSLATSHGVAANRTPIPAGISRSLSYGTGESQFDTLVYQERSIAAATTATYDLYAGTDLLDVYGDTAAFREVKALMVWVESGGDASGVEIGGAASQAWPGFFADATDKALIYPSGLPYIGHKPAGSTVGSSTNNLAIENLGAVAVVVRILIAGSRHVSGTWMGPLGLTYS